jgi:hypothetical protein
MKRMLLLLTLVVVACGASGCVHILVDCVHGSGTVARDERSVSTFRRVVIKGATDVVLRQGAAQQVVVEAEDNLLPLIRTAVENGELVIDTRKCIESTRPVVVHVTAAEPAGITISGSGDVTGPDKIDAKEFDIRISGSGDVRLWLVASDIRTQISGSGDVALRGSARSFESSISGSGDINASDLAAVRAAVRISGSGDCRLDVTEQLDVSISGSGDVGYKGPVRDVRTSISGSGDVRPLR